jgi:hypothetical protein
MKMGGSISESQDLIVSWQDFFNWVSFCFSFFFSFFDWQGNLFIDFLHERCIITATYSSKLLNEVRAAYRCKNRNQPI